MFGKLAILFFALIGFLALVFVIGFVMVQGEYLGTVEFAQGMFVEICGALVTAMVVIVIEVMAARTGFTGETVTKADHRDV